MNFFGHAVVASWKNPAPEFVLGAMLPDLANMLGTRTPGQPHPALVEGVAFHHRTDHVFHETAVFRELSSGALAELRALGVGRGSARAIAHVGVEILLDAVLAEDRAAWTAYLGALELGARADFAASVGFAEPPAAARFAELNRFLLERGRSPRDVSPELVGQRLQRALAARPRLAIDDHARQKVELWAARGRPAVAAKAPALMRELAAGLL